MKFKTSREEKEFAQLFQKNQKLAMILVSLDTFTTIELSKEITLTSILRTEQEQAKLNPAVKKSPHMFWQGADIRSADFTENEKKRMLSFLNCFTYKSGQGRSVAMVHTVDGNVEHFHVQGD